MFDNHMQMEDMLVAEPPEVYKLKGNTDLVALSQDFMLFSHATTLLHSGLPCDVLMQMAVSLPKQDRPKVVHLNVPIMSGFPPTDEKDISFNNVLYLVPKAISASVLHVFGTLAICQRNTKYYCQVEIQKLPVNDVLDLKSGDLVDIHLTALDSNNSLIHFVPYTNKKNRQLAKLKFDQPRQQIIDIANDMMKDISKATVEKWKETDDE